MIDFTIPEETKAVREKVRQFVHEHCIPAEAELEERGLGPVPVSYTHLTLPTSFLV